MDILSAITQQCDALTTTVSPGIEALGIRIAAYLIVIMLVWYGGQEALASASFGRGFDAADFAGFIMTSSFAWMFVNYYDSPTWSLPTWINSLSQYVVAAIGTDSANNIQQALTVMGRGAGPGIVATIEAPYLVAIHVIVVLIIAVLSAVMVVVVGAGAIAMAVARIVGPVLIPWMIFSKTEFLFWGWLKAFAAFSFYKVIVAAILSIISNLLLQYYSVLTTFLDPGTMIQQLPLLIILTVGSILFLLSAPILTAAIFSGSTGGHGAGMGAAAFGFLKG